MFKALDQGVRRCHINMFTVKSKSQWQIIQRKVTAKNFLKLSRIFSPFSKCTPINSLCSFSVHITLFIQTDNNDIF